MMFFCQCYAITLVQTEHHIYSYDILIHELAPYVSNIHFHVENLTYTKHPEHTR